jgi:phage shock protein PspC (stress-responsive transcriptional regulator)
MNERSDTPETTGAGGESTPTAGGDTTAPVSVSRRLTRSRTQRMVAGVAGGMGEHFNVDPLVFRLAFVGLMFAGGVGLLLYLAAWILVPESATQRSVGEDFLSRPAVNSTWTGIALLVLGVVLLPPLWIGDPAPVWAVALITAGVLLYRSASTPAVQSPGAPPAPSPRAAAAPPAPVSERPRSNLGRFTAAATLLVLGGTGALDNLGYVSLAFGDYTALVLVVVGSGLLVGTLWGRSRGLIFAGVVLVPVALASSAVEAPLAGGADQRYIAPTTAVDIRDDYTLAAGEMIIDLTRMRWPEEPVVLDASVAFGRLEIHVPSGVAVEMDGRASMGEVTFFGQREGGVDVEANFANRAAPGAPRLVIDAATSLGAIELTATGEPAIEEGR